jgi:serine/threonine protein kinase
MEYIKGHTLRDVINSKGALSPRLALALIDPVVEGLGAAHAAGMIHRDVKPENVLIADDGRIKIGDFGLARAVTTTTSTGALIGTVAYLSPELVLGKPADARSDIYSTGIMLFEMLTGRQPFDGEVPIQVAYQHVNSAVGAPSGLVPGLAGEVDELVQWCTASDPEQRPVDGNALLAELRHIRTNLTDAELDLQPPAAIQAAAAAGTVPDAGPRGTGAPPAPARMPSRMPQSPPVQGGPGAQGGPGNHTELLAPIHGGEVPGAAPRKSFHAPATRPPCFPPPRLQPPPLQLQARQLLSFQLHGRSSRPMDSTTTTGRLPRSLRASGNSGSWTATNKRNGRAPRPLLSERSGKGIPGAGARSGLWSW